MHTVLSAQNCACTNCPQEMPDDIDDTFSFFVSDIDNDDLSSPTQGVCGVRLHFDHEYIGDLEISLISPAGQSVRLVGPVVLSGDTDFSVWDILFVPCATAAIPDISSPGIPYDAQFNNNQSWGLFGSFNGSYHPNNGCLEDFNTGTVTGTWTIHVTDNQSLDVGEFLDFEIIFCDEDGLLCEECSPNAGTIETSALTYCAVDSLLAISWTPQYSQVDSMPDPTVYGYTYTIFQNNVLVAYDTLPSVAGDYQVCGLNYSLISQSELPLPNTGVTYADLQAMISGSHAAFCAQLTADCRMVTVLDMPDTLREEVTLCAGECYNWLGESFCTSDTFHRDYTATNGCVGDSVLVVNILPELRDTIYEWACVGTCSTTPGFTNICAPGTYSDQSSAYSGCDSTTVLIFNFYAVQLNITAMDSLTCDEPIVELTADCILCPQTNTYTWSTTDGHILTTNQNIAQIDSGGYYTAIVQADTLGLLCSDTASIAVTYFREQPTPIDTISGPTNICNSNSSVTYQVSLEPSVDDVHWTVTNGTIVQDDTTSIEVLWDTSATSGQICAQAYNSCDTSATFCLAANITQGIQLNAAYTDTVCPYEVLTAIVSVDQLNADTVIWDFPQGSTWTFIQHGIDSLAVSGTFTDNVPFCASIINNCDTIVWCDSIIVSSGSYGAISAVIGDTIVCSGDTSTYIVHDIINSHPTFTTNGVGQIIHESVAGDSVSVIWHQAGTGFLQVNYGGMCNPSADTIISITIDPSPDFMILGNSNMCSDTVMLEVSASSAVLWTSSSSQISIIDDVANPVTLVGTSSTTSTAEIVAMVSDGQCMSTDTIDVTLRSPVYIDTIYFECDFTTSRYQIFVEISGGTGALSVQGITGTWNGNVFISNTLPSGSSYDFYFEDLQGCTTDRVVGSLTCDCTLEVEQPMNDTLTCAAQDVNIIGAANEGNVVYEWIYPQGSIEVGSVLVTDSAGSYQVIAIGQNGCRDTASFSISIDTLSPTVSLAALDTFTCQNTQVRLEAQTTTLSPEFEWFGPQTITSNMPEVTVSTPGQYYVQLTDISNGCTSTDSTTFIVDTMSIPISLLADTITCAQPIVALQASPLSSDVSYDWIYNNASISQEDSIQVNIGGQYTVVAHFDNGCTSEAQTFIEVDTLYPPAIAYGGQLDCGSASIQLMVDVLYTDLFDYTWTNPDGFETNIPEPEVTDAGIYQLTMTNKINGCYATDTALVTNNSNAPVAFGIATEVLDCDTYQTTLVADTSSAATEYIWVVGTDSITNYMTMVSEPGSYELIVVGQNSCEGHFNVQVYQDTLSPATFISRDTLSCLHPQGSLSTIDSAHYSYHWIGPNGYENDQFMISGLTDPGLYVLTVTNTNTGCMSIESRVLLDDFVQPDIATTMDSLTCVKSEASIQASSSVINVTFNWSGPAGFKGGGSKIIVNTPGEYSVIVEAPNGCINHDTTTVTEDIQLPNISINTIDTITCDLPSVTLNGASSSAIVNSWWANSDTIIHEGFNTSVEAGGQYYLIVEGENGCVSIDSAMVIEDRTNPSFTIGAVESLTCRTDSVSLSLNASSALRMLQWSGPEGTSDEANWTVGQSGWYQVEIIGSNGCSDRSVVEVLEDRVVPQVTLSGFSIDCTNKSGWLQSVYSDTRTVSYLWRPLDGQTLLSAANSPSVQVDAPGSYALDVVDEVNGCQSTTDIEILSNQSIPQVTIDVRDATCFDEEDGIVIIHPLAGGDRPYVYTIDDETVTNETVIANLPQGDHLLQVTDSKGCIDSVSFEISSPPALLPVLPTNQIVPFGDSVYVEVTLGGSAMAESYKWNYYQDTACAKWQDCAGQWFTVTYPLLLEVTVTDINGCEAQTSTRLLVEETDYDVYVPNVFSPNGDGSNDILNVFFSPPIQRVQLFQIFNRWGNQVFEMRDVASQQYGWDGIWRGKPLPPDVYVYRIVVEHENGETRSWSGDVTLLR